MDGPETAASAVQSEQLTRYRQRFADNARAVQPLNQRVVLESQVIWHACPWAEQPVHSCVRSRRKEPRTTEQCCTSADAAHPTQQGIRHARLFPLAPIHLTRLSKLTLPVWSHAQHGSQWSASASPVAVKNGDKEVQTKGVEVTVTPEMTGAGMVSSGAKLPPIPPVTGSRSKAVPSWGKPLPYPIMIADRRNNRLIEIAPDKTILWEFSSPNLKVYRGNEDVNFSADGKQLAVSEEDNFDVHIVDYEKRALTWTYGTPDHRGSGPGLLNYPDDAHLLADGQFITADIRNCRVGNHRPQDQCRHHPMGHSGQVQAQSAVATGAPQRRDAHGERRYSGDRNQRGLDFAHHPRQQGGLEREGA
jgi:hypothetical protein